MNPSISTMLAHSETSAIKKSACAISYGSMPCQPWQVAATCSTLPKALCPICSTIYLGGMFSFGEYPHHRGYHFLWESASPRQIRLLAMVCRSEGLTLDLLVQMSPTTRTEPRCEMRAVLAWLETCPFPETVQAYTDEHSQHLARRCPPGSAPDGSVHLWRGYAWEESCHLLGGNVLVSLAVALHPLAPSPFVSLLIGWHVLARAMRTVL